MGKGFLVFVFPHLFFFFLDEGWAQIVLVLEAYHEGRIKLWDNPLLLVLENSQRLSF